MPIFENANNINIYGGEFVDVKGDSHRTYNNFIHPPGSTQNYVNHAENVMMGDNHGHVFQGAGPPDLTHYMNSQMRNGMRGYPASTPFQPFDHTTTGVGGQPNANPFRRSPQQPSFASQNQPGSTDQNMQWQHKYQSGPWFQQNVSYGTNPSFNQGGSWTHRSQSAWPPFEDTNGAKEDRRSNDDEEDIDETEEKLPQGLPNKFNNLDINDRDGHGATGQKSGSKVTGGSI
ncbi:hypothetical protein FA15DRAFT_758429 [Coprinopsis marcescibilis]|uniref:Uncharacterized protein n=1 Tax=Coprinopsis marcescibilis TaxID=230819 RepID=A0A5C3KN14_COPMA|nr:hypothetical protein FA15DRAFT_758429 [Coprinopsis marcescibilis]